MRGLILFGSVLALLAIASLIGWWAKRMAPKKPAHTPDALDPTDHPD